MITKHILASIAACVISLNSALASNLDFSGAANMSFGSLDLDGATINHENSNGAILVGVGAGGQADGFCFIGNGCAAGGEIVFDMPITGLVFDIEGWNRGDSVDISAISNNNSLLTVTYTADQEGVGDFSGLIFDTLLFEDNASTGSGVAYSTFTFRPTAVPAPAALPLFASGIGAFALMRRKNAKRA